MSDKDVEMNAGADTAKETEKEAELIKSAGSGSAGSSNDNVENQAKAEGASDSANGGEPPETVASDESLPSQDEVNNILLGRARPEKEVHSFARQPASQLKKFAMTLSLALILALAAAGAYFYFGVVNSSSFVKGTTIGGINVEGMNQDQAVMAIDQVLKQRLDEEAVFFKGSYTHKEKLSKMLDAPDSRKAVAEAYAAEKKRSWKDFYDSLTGNASINYNLGIKAKDSVQKELKEEWDKKWSEPAVDASLDLDDSGELVIMPEKAGKKVDMAATFDQVSSALSGQQKLRFEILVVDDLPKVTEKDLEGMHELASYTSEYDTGLENRSHNLELATSKINKTKLEPGEVFSFNDTVGERTVAAGYLDALIFVGNQVEPGLGGGVCQVASTLYNAALLSGLDIVERHNHNLPITYVPLGRDATVNWGSMDFQFKNSTDSTIYIAAQAGGGSVTISIYGKGARPNVEVKSQVEGSTGFSTVEKLDPTLPPGTRKVESNGAEGYYASAWRIFYDDKGKEIKTETLSHDSYNGKDAIVLVGPPVGTPGTVPGSPGTPGTPGNNGTNPNSTPGTSTTGTSTSTTGTTGAPASTDVNTTP